MHAPAEIGTGSFQEDRSPERACRTSPLRGLWTHAKGGFYHDGRFATLADVIDHDDAVFLLGLMDKQKKDLVEYLKSLWRCAVFRRGRSLASKCPWDQTACG